MSIIAALFDQGCCCAPPEPGGAEGRIMSKFGLITECNVGIKPVPNDVLGCVMQSSNWSQITLCDPANPDLEDTWLGTRAREGDPIIVPFSLARSENLSGNSHQPNHWIWWTKNRCLELDLFYPGANACCCSSGESGYSIFFESAPVTAPFFGNTLQRCGEDRQGGRCIDGAFAEDFNACYLEGDINPEPIVGAFDQQFFGPQYLWSFNAFYPAATVDEQYEAHGTFGSACNTLQQNRSNQGLSTYQVRTAKYRSPDIWEILNFNDGKAIAVMVNSPSSVARRGRVSYYERHRAMDASNGETQAPFYINDPKDWDAQGAHGLFRYFFAFASEEFSYVRGEFPITEFLSQDSLEGVANQVILGKAVPSYFHQIADAVPIFSFQTNFMSCTGAAGEGSDDLTLALCEVGRDQHPDYPAPQQVTNPPDLNPTAEGWQDQCIAVDAALRTAEAEDMLACKDWREEIWEDLQTLSVFRISHDLAWTQMALLELEYTTAQALKPVGPVRVRGDYFDMRRIDPVTKLVDTTTRPPSLARCQDDSTGMGSEYQDSSDGQAKTLQVHKDIYNLVVAPSGFYQTATAATTIVAGSQYKIVTVGTTDFTTVGAASNTVGVIFVATGTPTGTGTVGLFDEAAYFAWQRLTQSVYFRTKPIGWDSSALFQNQQGVARDCRFRWLTNRGSAFYPEDSSTVIASLGTNLQPLSLQPQWCTNGNPQPNENYSVDFLCAQANCDALGSVVAYQWNSSIVVARHCRSHFYDGGSQPVCRGYENPTATTGECCAVTKQSNRSRTLVECPFEDSNICFARFINRPYQWNNSAVPFMMEPTLYNLVDRAAVCCEYPHPLQEVCDVNKSETRTGQTQTVNDWIDDPINFPEGCEEDNCREISASMNRCNSGQLCEQASSVDTGNGGTGEYHCGAQKSVIDAPLEPVAFKPGSVFYTDPFTGAESYVNAQSCSETFRINGFVGASEQSGGGSVHRYPVGHNLEDPVLGTPFIIPGYSSNSRLQSSECCSIDDRSDQRMGLVASGDNIQKYHWLSFPPISITTGP